MKKQFKNVLLIDIPAYTVDLPEYHQNILRERLKHQSWHVEERTGQKLIRPGLTYSRGLLTIAQMLIQNGFSVKYVNFSDPIDKNKLYDYVSEADIVGVTSYTATIKIAADLCKELKQINPLLVSIVGGSHVSSLPIQTLEEFSDIDYIVIGEAEHRIVDLLKSDLQAEIIPGTAYRLSDGTPVLSTGISIGVDLTDIPSPAYQLLSRPLSEYAHNIRTSRGCPYKCSFCIESNSWSLGRNPHHHLDQIISEILFLSNQVPEGTLIHFSDTIFNIKSDKVQEFTQKVKKISKKIYYSFDTRADLINKDQIKLLNDADFIYCRMGFENDDNEILKYSKKNINTNDQINASQIIRSTAPKMAIHAYYITGLPGCNVETLIRSAGHIYNLIDQNVVDVVGNKIFVPYPGTPYFNAPEKYGIKIKTSDWSKFDRRSEPVYDLNDITSTNIYIGYLLQETNLLNSLIKKTSRSNLEITSRLDLGYIYANYADKEFLL